MKSVPPVVPPVVVAEVAKEERVATTGASAVVDTQASVAKVGKAEREDAVVSITGMLRVKQSVNLPVVVIIHVTHRTDRLIAVRTMISAGIASLC